MKFKSILLSFFVCFVVCGCSNKSERIETLQNEIIQIMDLSVDNAMESTKVLSMDGPAYEKGLKETNQNAMKLGLALEAKCSELRKLMGEKEFSDWWMSSLKK